MDCIRIILIKLNTVLNWIIQNTDYDQHYFIFIILQECIKHTNTVLGYHTMLCTSFFATSEHLHNVMIAHLYNDILK